MRILFTLSDIFAALKTEIKRLAPENFTEIYDANRLKHIARYLQAISIRANRAAANPGKERIKAGKIKIYSDRLESLLKTLGPDATEARKTGVESFFWLLEEYKVSLFAQELKTAVPVSEKRLEKMLEEIDRTA